MLSKQLMFAQLVAGGMHKKDAYVQCGYKGKDHSRAASSLMLNEEIKEEIKRLHKESVSPVILSLIECKEELSGIIRDDNSSKTVKIKAIESLCKLSAWEIQKIEVSDATPSIISDDELMKFINAHDVED
jgi:phage terminase small subunit